MELSFPFSLKAKGKLKPERREKGIQGSDGTAGWAGRVRFVQLAELLIELLYSDSSPSHPLEIRWRCYSQKYLVGRKCSGYPDGAEVESTVKGGARARHGHEGCGYGTWGRKAHGCSVLWCSGKVADATVCPRG